MFKRVSALEKDHCELYPPHGEDKQSWMMGAVNVVLLVLLVWTFTAVCEDDDDITINCEDVTDPVGDEINLTCNVSYLNQNCYMIMYKFTDTAADGDICKEQFSKDLSKQESRVSCPYTAKKPMTRKFKFFLQTTCGQRTTYFSVNVPGSVIVVPDKPSEAPPVQTTDETTIAVIICLLSCFGIVIVALFLWKRRKTSRHPPDYYMAANNINEHSDREAL